PADLAHLLTEQHRPELADLDLRGTAELVTLMADDQALAIVAIVAVADRIAAAIDAVVDRLERGGRLIYVGAGTAGRLGVLDAAECLPTFNTDRVVGVMAGSADAMQRPRESAEDDADAGAAEMAALAVAPHDAVVGVAASGRTPYTIGAVQHAAGCGALTVGISCNPAAELSRRVDHPIELVTGPEVIAGSTRLKAGTAQKVVLNLFSTIAMVRLGKTFGNLMVDVRATNVKLRDRARRIVVDATAVDADAAAQALETAGGDVKVAIVMLLSGVGASVARDRLDAHGGVVRAALGEGS
ncbi:MAG: N-acetylmuramic acid 6-phosphate etherase, partial [Ilumatobacteraceae bacterium]